MGGLYPDAPGKLFMIDRDGSAGFGINTTQTTPFDSTAMTNLMKTAGGNNVAMGGGANSYYIGYIFPELRDIAGFCLISGWHAWGNWVRVETSSNTTSGVDGTWTDRGAMGEAAHFRSITALVVTGVKGIRFRYDHVSTAGGTRYLGNLHIYGSIPATSTPDRLRLWHPTLDQVLTGAYFDLGDVPRGNVVNKTFRVKNNSATLTANNVLITIDAPTDTTPTVVSQLAWAVPAAPSVFDNTPNIGNIAPEAISGILTLRLTAAANASLSTWRQRIRAAATTWS